MSYWECVKAKLKYPLIRAGLEVTALPAVRALFPAARGRGLIWTLHHVRPDEGKAYTPNAYLSVTTEFLASAIEESLAAGLTPVHLHDLPALLADPNETRRFVAFTLDDGYRNNREFAAPIFRRYGVPYTIFITPGFVERTRSMWWETVEALVASRDSFRFDFGAGDEWVQCRSHPEKDQAFDRLSAFIRTVVEDEAVERLDACARAYGVDPLAIVEDLTMAREELAAYAAEDPLVHFGAHTMTHSNLCRLSDERLRYEVDASVETVAAYTGNPPRSFSYPYGWSSAFCERAERMVAEAGIPVGVTTRPGVLQPGLLKRVTSLPRVSLNGYYQQRRYVRALISGVPFRLLH
ncbi:polysaccharide deacetylase family protein [Allorhizobium borbori]|uniref:Chitooligosaccharide deacetylase n=1 Tax=Allorhizobium borbori TaxID=485907 RepID=A0A7W6P2G1_9HYPH|nr:polysaccharide deacetylase family protein [Allorhizobium borbori]MBB4103806.1 peptidoglycan/xylan/chitin deacetylase (PgdA/CDA1 family) [Allorhizobium borbori]